MNESAYFHSGPPSGPPPSPIRMQRRVGSPPPESASGVIAWSLALAVARRWPWLVLAGVIGGVLGFHAGQNLWSTAYIAVAQLVRYDTPDPQLFQPRQIAPPTLVGMIDSTEIHARVGARIDPPLPAREVARLVRITPERNSDILNVAVTLPDPGEAVALANAYAEEGVAFTRELQAREAGEASRYLEDQLARVMEEISEIEAKLRGLPLPVQRAAVASRRPAALLERLDDARDELVDLLGRYTDIHPVVQEQRAKISALEEQFARLENEPAADDLTDSDSGNAYREMDHEVLGENIKALESQRLTLTGRLRLTRMLERSPSGYFRPFAYATPEYAIAAEPTTKIGMLAVLAALVCLIGATGVAAGVEIHDRRLKTARDVRRVTQLPVLASLARIDRMPSVARDQWAFRTWTALQNRLSESPNKGFVCGFTSSSRGEGRSLWVKAMAEAANRCGFRVLTITTRPSPAGGNAKPVKAAHRGAPPKALLEGDDVMLTSDMLASPAGFPVVVNGKTSELAANALKSPTEVAERLAGPESPPHVHIPLPGWVWNLERRKEWMDALRHWSSLDNLVILVELPPASVPESVLLAQNLPNLVWLTDSTRAQAPETRRQLETLRLARCNIVGAMVNRAPEDSDRYARWLPNRAALAMLAIGLPLDLPAQPGDQRAGAEAIRSRSSLSVSSPAQRAEWQERLTLGPRDVLRLGLYGQPELTRENIAIQPDGRISYLEVKGLMAAGLTVDELRAKLDEELGNYRRAPRSMVVPVEFRSKKYFMLGKVAQRGVFTLDRPLTIVEAVARARGFETGLSGRNVVELVDLSRSFLVRNGRRAPVNFAGLFASGDLTQNIVIEPGDYLYFPPSDLEEIHLLGAVQAPGAVTFTDGMTAARAIASRGGFTREAWTRRVLVVRGPLEDPQPIVVNISEVLAGSEPDVVLRPGDMVYVSERPWIKGEELLDHAFSAFVQSVVVFWATDEVIPISRRPETEP